MRNILLQLPATAFALCLSVFLATSCREDHIPTYSGGARIQWLTRFVSDSLRVDFSFTSLTGGETSYVVELPFKVIGPATGQERTFTLRQADDDSGLPAAVEGTDYTLPERLTVAPGALQGIVPVTLLRTAALDTVTKRLALEFVTGSEFGPGARLQQRAVIDFSNQLSRPSSWDYIVEWQDWGVWSRGKHLFINQVLGKPIADDFFLVTDATLLRIYLDTLKKALDRFNNDPDNIASGKAPVLSDPNDPKSAPISFSSQSV